MHPQVGVEDLRLHFKWARYLGHHAEAGYNGVAFNGVVNSWMRNVRVTNADTSASLYG